MKPRRQRSTAVGGQRALKRSVKHCTVLREYLKEDHKRRAGRRTAKWAGGSGRRADPIGKEEYAVEVDDGGVDNIRFCADVRQIVEHVKH